MRIHTALTDPHFDPVSPAGLLKSDPALLYYITERAVEAGGLPSDLRHDPRVQHPFGTDLLAEFTVGQEFLAATLFRGYRALGGDWPLHVFCVVLFGLSAAVIPVAAFALVRAAGGERRWAFFAALLAVLLPGNYRTIGFILIREDLALPFFFLHLASAWSAMCAAPGRRRAPRFLLSGVFLALSLATWHATGVLVAAELLVMLLVFAVSGRAPWRVRGSVLLVLVPWTAALLVPALRQAGLAFSTLAFVAWAAWGLPRLAWWRRLPAWVGGLYVLGSGYLAGLLVGLIRGGGRAYDHVVDVLLAKLRFLGTFPEDPTALSFDARLLWQGPFETLDLGWGTTQLGLGVLCVPLAIVVALRGSKGAEISRLALAWAFLVSLVGAWLVGRMIVLPTFLAPVLLALLLGTWRRTTWAAALGVLGLVVQLSLFQGFVGQHRISWYLPAWRQSELAALVDWVGRHVDGRAPIATDFMNSTALLAGTGNPIVLQPKYETDASRRRAEAFLERFYRGTPDEFVSLVRDDWRCEYVLIDRYTLWELARNTAGIPASQAAPDPGSAAATLLATDEATLRSVPALELVYRSPATIRGGAGEPSDFYRLYRLLP